MLGNILAVGLMSMGMGLSGVKDEPKMYAQDEATYTITYENATDWNNRASEIYTWLGENNYDSSNKLTISGNLEIVSGSTQTAVLTTIYKDGNYIKVDKSGPSANIAYQVEQQAWTYNGSDAVLNSISITSQTYYEALAEEPPMGEQIIPAIASGLGIIGALATTFLTGFGNLFYSSGALTPFAIFALVMLGIAVSFAVVKLVLNLIRSNTGA